MTLHVGYLIFILPLIVTDEKEEERKKIKLCAERLERVVQKAGSNVFNELQQKLSKRRYSIDPKVRKILFDEEVINKQGAIVDKESIARILKDIVLRAEISGRSPK